MYWIFCRSCLVGHPLRCRLDGRIDVQPDGQLRQFNTGRVLKGKSERAILWEQNSRVVAIAKRWLGGDLTACYGIPADTILARLQVVETEQRGPSSWKPPSGKAGSAWYFRLGTWNYLAA